MSGDAQHLNSAFRPPVSEHDGDSERTLAEVGLVEMLSDPQTAPATEEAPGRYTQPTEHARGGLGRILVVYDQHLGRQIALKELLPPMDTAEDGEPTPVRAAMPVVARFLEEARITGQLEHPSIVPVHELGHRKDGSLYYTMKLVRGRNLARAIHEAGDLPGRLALLSHFVDLCQAVAYAHSRNVIHRDIKPGNVMVGEFGETVLIDWGLAKVKGQKDLHADGLTQTLNTMRDGDESDIARTMYGQALGTPVYMPPEQARGELDKVDERSDVYSLGAVLYELITGTVPFAETSVGEIVEKVAKQAPRSPNELEKDAPPELVAICGRAMQRDPADRYESARELAEEIQRYLSGALVQTYDYKAADYMRWFVKKHWAVLAAAAAGVVLLLSVGVFYNLRLVDSRDRERGQRVEAEKARDEAVEAHLAAEGERYSGLIARAKARLDNGDFREARTLLLKAPEAQRGWEWGRLLYLCHRDLRTFSRSTNAWKHVFSIPYGRLLTIGNPGPATLWDLYACKNISTFDYTLDPRRGLSLSPDGSLVAEFAPDGTLKVFRTSDGFVLWTAEFEQLATGPVIRAPAFSPDGKLLAVVGKRLVEDSSTESTLATASPPTPGTRTTYAARLRRAAGPPRVSERLFAVTVIDAQTGDTKYVIQHKSRALPALEFLPSGERLVINESSMVTLFLTENGEPAGSLAIGGCIFSPDGRRCFANEAVWDLESCEEICSLPLRSPAVALPGVIRAKPSAQQRKKKERTPKKASATAVAFTPNGTRLLTGHQDGSVTVWDAETGDEKMTLQGHTGQIASIAVSADGRRIVTGSWDRTVRIWDAVTGAEIAAFEGHDNAVSMTAINDDGRRVCSVSQDGTTKVWDVDVCREDQSIWSSSSGWCADGRQVVTFARTSSFPGVIRARSVSPSQYTAQAAFWNMETCQISRRLKKGLSIENTLEFTADGQYVLGGTHAIAMLLSSESGEPVRTYKVKVGREKSTHVACWTVSPGGSCKVVAGRNNGNLLLWQDVSAAEPLTIEGHTTGVRRVVFCGAGDDFLSLDEEGTVKVWDGSAATLLFTLADESGAVSAFVLSPDRRRLLTFDDEQDCIFWDVDSGEELWRFRGEWPRNPRSDAPMVHAAFTSSGQRILITSLGGKLRVVSADTGKTVEELAGRGLELVALAGTADENRIAAVRSDGLVRIWSPEGREVWSTRPAKTLGVAIPTLRNFVAPSWDVPRDLLFASSVRSLLVQMRDRIVVLPAFPWRNKDFPGDDSMPLAKRVEQYKHKHWQEHLAKREEFEEKSEESEVANASSDVRERVAMRFNRVPLYHVLAEYGRRQGVSAPSLRARFASLHVTGDISTPTEYRLIKELETFLAGYGILAEDGKIVAPGMAPLPDAPKAATIRPKRSSLRAAFRTLASLPAGRSRDVLRLAAVTRGAAETQVALLDESTIPPSLFVLTVSKKEDGIEVVEADVDDGSVLLRGNGTERRLYLHGYASDLEAGLAGFVPKPAAPKLRLKFKDCPLDLVLSEYEERSGEKLLIATNLPLCTITLQSPQKITVENYLLGIRKSLEMHGIAFTQVEGGFTAVVPSNDPIYRFGQHVEVTRPATSTPPTKIPPSKQETYAERLKRRKEAIRARQPQTPTPAGEELQKVLQEYQMELIRAGGEKGPPLPLPLSREMDDQLVREGVLPPAK